METTTGTAPQTDEEKKQDIQARMEEFKKRHLANVEELQVDFVLVPQFVQVNEGLFATQTSTMLVDKKYAPIPSPLSV